MTKPFTELRVVELAGSHAGAFTGKMFADYGAQVVKVVPPDGDPLMRHGEPLPAHALGDAQVGSIWAYCNTSKRITDAPSSAPQVSELLAGADVAIESSDPDPLNPITAELAAPRLVRVLISPFGLSGPWSNRRSNVFTDDAASGHMLLNGEPDRHPFRRHGRHTEYAAGMYGFIGALAALIARESTGVGQTVEVSHLEAMVAMHQHTTTMWTHAGHILKRDGNAQPGMWHPAGVYECADGFVFLGHATGAKLEPFLQAAGLQQVLDDPRFATNESRGRNKRAFDEAIRPWLMAHTSDEICELGEATFSPMGPVWSTHEFLADPHMKARDFFVPLDEARGDETIPRGPFRLGADFQGGSPRPPSAVALDDLSSWRNPEEAAPASRAELPDGPLSGLRVLDLTRVWAGPIAGRLLGDLGADVIHIESPWNRGPLETPADLPELTHLYPDNELGERPWNRNGGFNKLARNKRGLALDLSSERGQELFRALIAKSDVVLENFSPRVFPQWGLDWPSLREINPFLIHTSMPGYGATGPGANRVALGPVIEAATGMTMMAGYADGIPYRSGVAWPDPVSGMSAVAGALVGVWQRLASGGGQPIETAMIESMGSFAGDELLTAQIVGQPPPRRGNREPGVAPQGVYRCLGDDRWLAVSVTSDAEWRSLCRVAGLPDGWQRWELWEREARHDEIDAALNIWARSISPSEAAMKLQDAGVIAAGLADARDLLESEQLAAREFWAELGGVDMGVLRYPGCPIRLSETPPTYRRGAPGLGEHNFEVCAEWLGMSDDEIGELLAARVLADRPPSMAELQRPRV